ncbi:hypothetical protein O181_030478 [Austropuccinia psidii MF-1]|uniref:Uncharacterized protein n=1 Tax=Austropuccinia psidii MF-1 TaxID=1389203 RepID=A0A9Q3H3Q8_9BASI|nr:hypothetical protein [Austropuccinia psidii MF-1]
MKNRILSRKGLNFLDTNFKRVPLELTNSSKELVKKFNKEKKEIPKKIIEKEIPLSRPEVPNIVVPKKEEKEVSITQVEDWVIGNHQQYLQPLRF